MELPNGKVLHEPFSIPYYFGPQRLSEHYTNDEFRDVTYKDTCAKLTARYEEDANIDFLFSKNLSYYVTRHGSPWFCERLLSSVLPSPEFLHTFLIRRPDKAIVSLYKASMKSIATFDATEVGFADLLLIYSKYQTLLKNKKNASEIIIVDADDLLDKPGAMLKRYCEAVGLKYEESMLRWEAGPVEEFKVWEGWHDDVEQSSGFRMQSVSEQEQQSKEERLKEYIQNELPKQVRDEIDRAFAIYDQLFAKRLRC